MLFSFHDPAQDGFYETEFDGQFDVVFLTRQNILTLQNAKIDLPLPRECLRGPNECKFRTPIDQATLAGEWFNESFIPWWDTDKDKRAGWRELESIILKNLPVLSLVYRRDLEPCRNNINSGLCINGVMRLQARLMKEFGSVSNEEVQRGATPRSCRDVSDAAASVNCRLTVLNLESLKATLEATRRRTLRSIGARPRFNMAKLRRIQSVGGFEFASPDPTLNKTFNHNVNTLRFSSMFEATGEYIRLGSSRHLNVSVCRQVELVQCYENITSYGSFPEGDGLFSIASGWSQNVVVLGGVEEPWLDGLCNMTLCEWNASLDLKTMSHVFIDGIIKEKIPLRFDGGSLGNGTTHFEIEMKRQSVLGRERVELPKADPNHPHSATNVRVITLPDASGNIITTSNLDEVKTLPGLRTKRPSPFRYDRVNQKELEDGRIVEGSRYWYKRMVGGDNDGVCGTFDDGTVIPCPSVKVQYDALEASGSAGDEVFIYNGVTKLQGPQLSPVPASVTPEPRIDCSPLRNLCESNDLRTFGETRVTFLPKAIAVCAALDNSIYDDVPIACDFEDPGSCAGSVTSSRCTAFPIWGTELNRVRFRQKWTSFGEYRATGIYRQEWQMNFDPGTASSTAVNCLDAAELMASPSFDFLHIYYGTDRGSNLVDMMVARMGGETRLGGTGPNRNETSLRWYALTYLDLQGVAGIRIGSDVLDVKTALLKDDLDAQLFVWAASLLEQCFGCCLRNQATESLMRAQALVGLEECSWINITGTVNPQNTVLEGAYRLLEERSFGRPVWKQDPGELYLHFLPSACTSTPDCGPGADPHLRNSGPAWVIGPEVGKDRIVMWARPPSNEGWFNGTYYTAADGYDFLTNTTKGYSWYNPALLEEAVADTNGTWFEHYENDVSDFGNDTIYGERWFFTSPEIAIYCSDLPLHRYATTAVVFDDGTDFRKLTLPDVDGILISKGNLEMVTKVGIQNSPILGRSREFEDEFSPATRIKFGVGWQSVKVESTNNLLSVAISARQLAYCAVRKSTCEYRHPPPTVIQEDANLRQCYPLSPENIDCPWPGGTPVLGQEYGVDGLILSEKDQTSCVAFFPAHEWYYGTGTFESLGTDRRCFGDVGGIISTSGLYSEYTYETSPPYWGVSGPSSACPSTPEYLGEFLDTPTDLCVDLLRSGCQDACLRDPSCTAARFYYTTYQCAKVYECAVTVPKQVFEQFEDMNKTSGGWTPSRWRARELELGVGATEVDVGATLVLNDMPDRTWVVTERDRVQEPCPIHIRKEDADSFSTAGCTDFRAAAVPLRMTWNMTATHRYRMCLQTGGFLGSDGLGSTLTTRVLTSNITQSSSLPLRVFLSDVGPFVQTETVRINEEYFSVLAVNAADRSALLGLPPSASPSSTVVSDHPEGSPVVPVFGGIFNSTTRWDIRVPPGVYSLENITETLNREVRERINARPLNLSFQIQEPGAGLCGEVAAGSSHDVEEFHCAPSSRFLSLEGSVSNASGFGSDDDIVQVLPSNILGLLGFAQPANSYTFTAPRRASMPPEIVNHAVLPGAGYLSSGYGHHSGFGRGGQEGWIGSVPPQPDIDPVTYTIWCHDGAGYQCFSSTCGCSSAPVLTSSKILGSTRTQRGNTPESNTIAIPSNGDGIVISTGNLEDISVDSAAITGLRIDALKEHQQGLAARVGGWLQFSACASLFGPNACSLITEDDVSIRLGSTDQLAVHSYHRTTFWVALYNASKELHAAAIVNDTHATWELLPSELSSINRTFAARQDVFGVESAAQACNAYCDELTVKQRREAEAATQILKDAMVRAPASVWRTSRDPQSFCTVVECSLNQQLYPVTAYEDPYAACAESSFCSGNPTQQCTCSSSQRCSALWIGALPPNLASADPNVHAQSWERCVRSLSLEQRLTPGCNCEGFNYTDPNAQPGCCRDLNLLNRLEQLEDKVTDAEESFFMFKNLEFFKEWEPKQWNETLQVCSCIELEGAVLSPGAGEDAVIRHACAVGDARFPSPVCESGDKNVTIGSNGSTTTTFLHVERPSTPETNYLTVPSAHGVILTTGNLDAITKEAGSMTSLHVRELSLFREQIWIGTVGEAAESQGSRYNENTTILFGGVSSPFCQGTQVSDTAHTCMEPHLHLSLTQTSIDLEDGSARAHFTSTVSEGNWTIDFPTWDDNLCVGEVRSGCEPRVDGVASLQGKVITTGNLQDVTAMSPNRVDTAGTAIMEGEVRLGSSHACSPERHALYGASYTRYGWRAHTATECREAQDQVDWDSDRVLSLGVDQCKELCELDPSCEVLVVKIDVDRFPTNDAAKCMLLSFPERKCTLESNPVQDTYLLQRKAPSPWLDTIADQQFFDALCQDSINATHIPGVPINLDGYIQGDIIWRQQAPMSWRDYRASQCDDFPGFTPAARTTVLENVTVDECKAHCEASTECGVVTFQGPREISVYMELDNPNCTYQADLVLNNTVLMNNTNGTMFFDNTNGTNTTLSANMTSEMHAEKCNTTFWAWRTVVAPPRCALNPLVSERRFMADGTTVPGLCTVVPSNDTDVYIYSRNEHVSLKFKQPTGDRELVFSDASGVIITTGNTYDIDRNIGLSGQDSWVVTHAQRERGLGSYDLDDDVMFGGARSVFSGVLPGLIIRNCGQNGLTCDVYVADDVSEADLQREIAKHITSRSMTVNRLVRGRGNGFNQRQTIIDFAVPGSRTSGECFGNCKGALTCERGTTSCTRECPGYMFDRPGVDMSLECTTSGSRGEVCGCANGEAYGQFGTSVCVMRDESHPDHGRFCATRSGTGESLFLFDCCQDDENCGDCITFPPEKPVGMNNRITFPQATGVVVTTGNIDDVVLRNIQLNGLDLKGYVDLGIGYPADSNEPTLGNPSGYRYDPDQEQMRAHLDLHPVSTKVTGGLRMVAGFGSPNKLYGTPPQAEIPGTAVADKYTHLFTVRPTAMPEPLPQHAERYCVESVAFEARDEGDPQQQTWERDLRRRCEYKREILIPPTSGTVLTVEHLDDVPAVAIPVEDLIMTSVDSSFIVEGNLTFGKVVNYTTDPFNNGGYGIANQDRIKQSVAKLYNQFDGDVGLTMQSAGERIALRPSTQGLSDLPDYGKNMVGDSPYSAEPFSGPYPFGGPAPAQVIEDFAAQGRKGDGEVRSFSLDFVRISMPQGGGVDTAARTYLRGGAPSLPISVQDSRSVPSEPNQLSDHYAYRSGQPVLQQRSIIMPSARDSYAPAVDGSPREPHQALHGSSAINVSWCYHTMASLPAVDPSNNVRGVRTLSMFMSFMVEQGFLVPTLLSGNVTLRGSNETEAFALASQAFDADLGTAVNLTEQCSIGLDLGEGNAADVTFIRYAAGKGFESELVGGRFQGSNDNTSFADLVVITELPLAPVYILQRNYERGEFRYLRYLGPAGSSGCHIAEVEFHSGELVIELSELQHGQVSWRVDEEVLFRRENVEAAMMVKCAAHGMIPSMLDNDVQEVILPEAQGQIITTGNLEDISLKTGSFTSVGIAGELEIDGWVSLGVPDQDSLLKINSQLDSSSYFTFGGPTTEVGAMTSLLTNSMPEDKIAFMPDVSGTLVLGELPSVMEDVMVMEEGGLDLNWGTKVRAKLQLGVVNQAESPASLDIHAVIGSSRPLSFDGTFTDDGEAITLGVADASSSSILTLPDVSGTVLTSSSMPRALDNVTAIEGELTGNVYFHDLDVEIGMQGGKDGVSMHANILGLGALLFDGTTRKDGRTLTLSALDPDSDSELTLPDTTGTVITSANFPRKFDTLRSLDEFQVKGNMVHTGDLFTVGRAGGRSKLTIRAQISGRVPLLFDGGLRGVGNEVRRTSFLMPDSSRANTITFPDVSGTVLTTSNQPTRIVTEGRYNVNAESVTVATDTMLLGLGVVDGVERGSFLFSDLLAKQYNHRPERANQFSSHCSGGAVFITGETTRGKATGATLAPKASAWSYVSDRNAKEVLAAVNGSEVLEALRQVEVSRWRYDVAGAEGAEHLGPMAQGVFDAFGLGASRERIGVSDADGIVLGAVHGLHARVESLRRELEAERAELQRQEAAQASQEAELERREAEVQAQALRLQRLWAAAKTRPVVQA